MFIVRRIKFMLKIGFDFELVGIIIGVYYGNVGGFVLGCVFVFVMGCFIGIEVIIEGICFVDIEWCLLFSSWGGFVEDVDF